MNANTQLSPATTKAHFDPCQLQPLATLNRRRFLIRQGIDDDVAGKTAYEILSRDALSQTIARYAHELRIGADTNPAHLPRQLNACLSAQDAHIRALALSIAEQYGRRLGWLFASMNRSNSVSSEPNGWEQAFLAHWEQNVQAIIIGGGLAQDRLGTVIARAAQCALSESGRPDLTVSAANYAAFLPLIGAARSVPAVGPGGVVVADFGGTMAKSGVAVFDEQSTLKALQVRPVYDLAGISDGTQPAAIAVAMKDVITWAYRAASQRLTVTPHVVCSIAAYLDEQRQPVQLGGRTYNQLSTLAQTAHVSAWLARQLGDELSRPIDLTFIRDCEGAAVTYAGLAPPASTAVVMLGTALGVGFVPEGTACRSMARTFTVFGLA